MTEKKYIGLIEAIKNAVKIGFENQNLGYYIKASIVSSLLSFVLMIPVFILFMWALKPIYNVTKSVSGPDDTFQNSPRNLYPDDSTDLETKTTGLRNVLGIRDTRVQYPPQVPPIPATRMSDYAEKNISTSFGEFSIRIGIALLVGLPFLLIVAFFIITFQYLLPLKLYLGELMPIGTLIKTAFRKSLTMAIIHMLVKLLTGLGYLFLIIPGIIFSIKYSFSPLVFLEEDCRPVEALKRSWKLTSGYTFNLFLKGLGMIFLAILALLPFFLVLIGASFGNGVNGILAFIVQLVAMLTYVVLYKDLKRVKGAELPGSSAPEGLPNLADTSTAASS